MNQYTIDDLYIGLTESFSVTVTEQMMEGFRVMTGDINPLHTDEDYARSKGFDSQVVYGFLTSSLLSTLAGVYLPGKQSLIREVELKLKKPVYIGDELTVSGEVDEIRSELKIFEMKVSVVNQKGEKVLRGKMKMGLL